MVETAQVSVDGGVETRSALLESRAAEDGSKLPNASTTIMLAKAAVRWARAFAIACTLNAGECTL